jgi:hypothetical protein
MGNLDFPIRSKNLFYQGDESTIFYDTELLYRVNPFDNTVEVYKKPKVISFIKEKTNSNIKTTSIPILEKIIFSVTRNLNLEILIH